MAQQAETSRVAGEQSREELRTEFAARFPALEASLTEQRDLIAAHQSTNDAYQKSLQAALEERLAEFANHQHWRLNDLEDKVAAKRDLDPETMIEIRQTVRDDMEKAFNGINVRLDDFVNVHRRFDDQSSALVQHVNDTTSGLAMRMDEGDQRVTHAVEDRLNSFEAELGTSLEGLATQVNDHASTLLAKLESSETRAIDRLLELEARTKEDTGTRLATIEATIGRVGSGFDDAMIAINQRVLELENSLLDVNDRIGEIAERLAKVDENVLDEVRAEMSNAVGEAMLVRIELDRHAADTSERMDKQIVRMSEIEGMLADTMDVSTAVQLERLDELERQMSMIDGTRVGAESFAGRNASDETAGSNGDTPAGGGNRVAPPSMTLNPRLLGADSTAHDGTLEAEQTFSTH